jgi:hypothetical protein
MLVSTMVHGSVEARDAHVESGMEEGILDSYSRLDELFAEEQAR